jgi:hypothetical protein|tara:strand:- start:333 stop:1001 length:669 start_codon:yes stop_codon:yes gene_type:complete
MKNILARGGIEFLAVFLGIALSLYVDEWREENQIRERLMADYHSIQKDLEIDIPYLERIIVGQTRGYENGMEMIQMLDKEESFNYGQFVKSSLFVTSGSTFFGTKASYQASVSSGRLTYFGIDSLSNEIGKVYEHHYNRLDLNGLLLDELNFFKLPNINSGPRYLSEKIKQQNLDKIFSPEYYPGLKDFLTLQNSYINKCKWALEQMKRVNALLLYQLNIKS